MGGGEFKNCQKLRDIIYERPITQSIVSETVVATRWPSNQSPVQDVRIWIWCVVGSSDVTDCWSIRTTAGAMMSMSWVVASKANHKTN